MLYIVATPIGNLKDITLRALETLKDVDGVICEDSRKSGILLNHYQIKKPLFVLNDFNETKLFPQILDKLKSGQNLALISDAGTPLISDPGYKLVRECINQDITVDSLPGACAPIVALTLSSLPPDKFTFLGYPPDKSGHRQKFYEAIKESNKRSFSSNKSITATYILFIAPFKLLKTLTEMQESFGDIDITLAKELTKIHQQVKSQKITTWVEQFKKQSPKGEWIMLFRI